MNPNLLTQFAAACSSSGSFLGLPTWYQYLQNSEYAHTDALGNCVFHINGISTAYWLIALGIIDMLLRIAGLVAVGYVIYGGIRYITSQGEPDNTRVAQKTIQNALVGAVIAGIASAVVHFIAKSLI